MEEWEAVKTILASVAGLMILYQLGKWIYRPRPAPEWYRLLVSKGRHEIEEESDEATIYLSWIVPHLEARDRYLLAALAQEMAKRHHGS